MTTPPGVRQAIAGVWATIGISSLVAVFAKLSGLSSEGEFIFALIAYGLCCIIPYKLGNRSNAARYFYVVFTVASVLMLLAGVGIQKKLEFYASILMLPLEAFIVFRLFQAEASAWFARQ